MSWSFLDFIWVSIVWSLNLNYSNPNYNQTYFQNIIQKLTSNLGPCFAPKVCKRPPTSSTPDQQEPPVSDLARVIQHADPAIGPASRPSMPISHHLLSFL
jgi:hypothetical protein